MPITLDSVVKQTGELAATPLGGDLVILNIKGDNYVGLDQIGRRVWDLLASRGAVKDVCSQVASEYQGNEQEITGDILIFLDELHAEGLIDAAEPAKP